MQKKAKKKILTDAFCTFTSYWNIRSMTLAYYSRSVPYHYDFSDPQSKWCFYSRICGSGVLF